MKLKSVLSFSVLLLFFVLSLPTQRVYKLSDYGLQPNSRQNASPVLQKVISRIRQECKEGEEIVLRFAEGQYHFYEKGAAVREYYISNHDQDNPKRVGIALEDMKNLTVDGLIYRRNVIKSNTDYKPFHPNQRRFWLERVTNISITE